MGQYVPHRLVARRGPQISERPTANAQQDPCILRAAASGEPARTLARAEARPPKTAEPRRLLCHGKAGARQGAARALLPRPTREPSTSRSRCPHLETLGMGPRWGHFGRGEKGCRRLAATWHNCMSVCEADVAALARRLDEPDRPQIAERALARGVLRRKAVASSPVRAPVDRPRLRPEDVSSRSSRTTDPEWRWSAPTETNKLALAQHDVRTATGRPATAEACDSMKTLNRPLMRVFIDARGVESKDASGHACPPCGDRHAVASRVPSRTCPSAPRAEVASSGS